MVLAGLALDGLEVSDVGDGEEKTGRFSWDEEGVFRMTGVLIGIGIREGGEVLWFSWLHDPWAAVSWFSWIISARAAVS